MQVFLSWSKPRSHAACLAFYEWLPDVLQSVTPWMSSEDIASGSGWNQEIRRALEASNYGILFVTRENHDQPWLMFEAGALAKHVSNDARVVPLIVDDELEPNALVGPLGQLQARKSTKDNIFRLVKDLDSACEGSLDTGRLRRCFDAHWDSLEKKLTSLPDAEGEAPELKPDELIQEMYNMLRSMKRDDAISRRYTRGRPTGKFSSAHELRHYIPSNFVSESSRSRFDQNLEAAIDRFGLSPLEVAKLVKFWLDVQVGNTTGMFIELKREGSENLIVKVSKDGEMTVAE